MASHRKMYKFGLGYYVHRKSYINVVTLTTMNLEQSPKKEKNRYEKNENVNEKTMKWNKLENFVSTHSFSIRVYSFNWKFCGKSILLWRITIFLFTCMSCRKWSFAQCVPSKMLFFSLSLSPPVSCYSILLPCLLTDQSIYLILL